MGNRLSKIYTRTGDDGSTGLGDGARIRKDAPRVEAYGTVDELNSTVGVLAAHPDAGQFGALLAEVQQRLFDLGGEVCIPDTTTLPETCVERLEQELDTLNESLPPLKDFILPGGTPAAAACHMARTVCRRAERRLVTLSDDEYVNPISIRYLNRLSDLLFVMARTLNKASGSGEILWNSQRDS